MSWTYESLQEEAKKYKTRKEFAQKNRSAYQSATGRGYLDEICSHMTPTKKVWTKDEVLKEARKYNTYPRFHNKAAAAAITAKREGWLDEACAHMSKSRR